MAFLFPGQGAKDLFAAASFAASELRGNEMLDRAAEAAGIATADLLARGGRALERTEVQQPVVTAIGLFVHAELVAAGVKPDVVAGHSLGELAAWAATGAITPEDAITIAALRGRLMAKEAARHPGAMFAFSGLSMSERGILQRALARCGLEVAASNTPDELVVSGDEKTIHVLLKTLEDTLDAFKVDHPDTRFRAKRLPVAGPWHSESMKDAVPELEAALTRAHCGAMQVPMVLNATGNLAEEGLVPRLLAGQLVHTVHWTDVMATLKTRGVTDFVTMAPGAVLRSLVRTNLGTQVRVHTTENATDLRRTVDALRWSLS
ncbi:ACP S-malonyltransferase [Polyangium jinanense]|uniref:[acyl-carrier-protein] S-malonyltransferase n=1 Tax=Polyangium jinanense TaxID=2829994 RepID=A0A9X4AQB3_9BACT|nr:ACP S-malonyltransferase [Polyangium jinanense]MDC3954626.1 ACP S-malonyltransferase [Polyangium jinanense]MDC3980929.1 ACP S-malonyltransferase [Polyangium jinanense]